MDESKLTEVEVIKAASRHLRGGIAAGLIDPLTAAIAAPDIKVALTTASAVAATMPETFRFFFQIFIR